MVLGREIGRQRALVEAKRVEIGGKVLGPMVGRTLPDVSAISVMTMADIEALVKEI